ncbi:helix-turn-helix domain-containing protein [Candidatus Arsenophonus triatominarum]|uniref:helix-turn-helix domain-containing protein n=1 Tax=Candidatus Arsenophonus triatominarum TaxID=57911 RepID=UPI0007C500C5|nr:helix-turn-helix transcriptional regulator [Candidatus Arsenophonus triatominarum]
MKKMNIEKESLITQRLDELLKTRHMSKSDMARLTGVSRASVNGWFKRGSISKEAALKLSSATGVSLAWILGEDASNLVELSQDEMKLLDLFRELPNAEKLNMLSAFEMRLKELKEYYNRYVIKNN